ncbi:MAG: ATP-binding protein [Ignavibacteriaceae bacterium]
MSKKKIFEKVKEYHFQFKHLTVLFVIIFSFQLIVSLINKSSIKNFLDNTQGWYQKDSAEKLANLTATSIELILETINPKQEITGEESKRIIQSFNIIFSQQVLQHNIDEICILIKRNNKIYAVDDGKDLFAFLLSNPQKSEIIQDTHLEAIKRYKNLENKLSSSEQIYSVVSDKNTFNTFVPFVLRGEYVGAVYIKNTPDFSFLTSQIASTYDETSIIYLSLISLGLLTMYFISSYTVKERDEAQKELFKEHETNLKKKINYDKELIFTKRFYHTHHKAEKVMGFIKGDLQLLCAENIDEIKYRVSKYANFISRVIYDMKWYDQPIQTIRNQIYNTNINELIMFLVDNIFLRTAKKSGSFDLRLDLDEWLPMVHINEFVVWEILEPLIQNAIEHGKKYKLIITIRTKYYPDKNESMIFISDNGQGISPEFLVKNNSGIKKLFQENITSKNSEVQNSGYGCYIANEICKRCGWQIDAENLEAGGSIFTIKIKH